MECFLLCIPLPVFIFLDNTYGSRFYIAIKREINIENSFLIQRSKSLFCGPVERDQGWPCCNRREVRASKKEKKHCLNQNYIVKGNGCLQRHYSKTTAVELTRNRGYILLNWLCGWSFNRVIFTLSSFHAVFKTELYS